MIKPLPKIINPSVRSDEAVLDQIYLKYAASDPFLPVTHFVDHSTMGAEALVGLGVGHRVIDWSKHHPVRPYQRPFTGISISETGMAGTEALGRAECFGDWLKYFEAELQRGPYQEVLMRWVPRFAHEVGAFLFHGLIRTAHAVRALEHLDTSVRRGELARGLALWAVGVKSGPPVVAETIRLETQDPEAVFLSYARAGAISFIHASTVRKLHLVTGPMAYLLIADYFNSAVHGVASHSFQKTHWNAIQNFDALRETLALEPLPSFETGDLEALASQHDAHPIKLTEAALRAYQATHDDVFLKAAGRVRNRGFMKSLEGIEKLRELRRAA